MLVNFPLLVVPLIVYNLVAFSMADPGLGPQAAWAEPVTQVTMVSGIEWTLTMGDLLLMASLVMLFIEVLKATRTGASSIVDHLLSTAVFVACLVEFLLVEQAATSTFFLLMIMTLFDVMAGFSVTIRAARRDFGVGPDGGF
ncbi:hypothetical protein ACKTEK_13525 [Tepidamorphus sp. 3E244]|uniref:hypothetical protein n=1 Tax=Tepidamorphus sp. 3E244 TaxID=3385498 RepID=UPI0038FCD483